MWNVIQCILSDIVGYAGETLFNVSCPLWKEWKPTTTDASLKYEYRVKAKGANRAMLFYYGDNPDSTPSMFPVGNPNEHMLTEVELYIVDSVGDNANMTFNVTVWLPILWFTQ